MNFSDKLKRIIELEDINLKEFSDLTGLNYDTVRRYKSGSRSPTLDQIQKILASPRFEKYKDLLLSHPHHTPTGGATMGGSAITKQLNASDQLTQKALDLFKRLEELGRAEEALAILQAIEENAKK